MTVIEAAGERDGRTDEGGQDHQKAARHRDRQDLQAVRPVGPRQKAAGQYLLDSLCMQRDTGHVLSKRIGANVLQPGRRCSDKHDAAFDGSLCSGEAPPAASTSFAETYLSALSGLT